MPLVQQLLYFVGALISLPLLPILYWQGLRVRANIPDLPEAGGPREGTSGEGNNPIRVLALGESAFAGVGVASQEEGISGRMAYYLHENLKRPVAWQLLARSGFSAQKVADELLLDLPQDPLDLIVIGLGGNDTFELNSPLTWKRDMERIIQKLRLKHDCPVLIANLPPVGQFPAFPPLLRVFMGSLLDLHRRAIMDLPMRYEKVDYLHEGISLKNWKEQSEQDWDVSDFFSDGIHPSILTYDLWARGIAERATHLLS